MPEHFFFCVKSKKATRRAHWHQPQDMIPELLGTIWGAIQFSAWLKETRFYTEIRPMWPSRPPASNNPLTTLSSDLPHTPTRQELTPQTPSAQLQPDRRHLPTIS